MADQENQGTPGNPENPDDLANQVNEAFAEAGIDADSVADAEAAEAKATGSADSADSDADPVAAVKAELAERTDDLQRLSAEFTNYRRRIDRDRVAEREQIKASVLSQFLTLADDIDLADQHGDLADGTPLKALADKFRNTLSSQGAEKFGAAGDEFNPEIHEAVQDLSSGDEKVIDTVLRAGYRVGDRIVRTAMVILGDPA